MLPSAAWDRPRTFPWCPSLEPGRGRSNLRNGHSAAFCLLPGFIEISDSAFRAGVANRDRSRRGSDRLTGPSSGTCDAPVPLERKITGR